MPGPNSEGGSKVPFELTFQRVLISARAKTAPAERYCELIKGVRDGDIEIQEALEEACWLAKAA